MNATATATPPATTRPDPAPGKAVVLFDGMCQFCIASVGILRRLDWLKRMHWQNARDTDRLPPCAVPLELAAMLEEMHLVTPDRKRSVAGFSAFRWMAWRIPLLLPLAPFLYLPGVLWLGNRIYLTIARNRYDLIPCHDGACAVPLKKK